MTEYRPVFQGVDRCNRGHDLTLPGARYDGSGYCRVCAQAATQISKDRRVHRVNLRPSEQPGNPELAAELTGLPLEEVSARCSEILARYLE